MFKKFKELSVFIFIFVSFFSFINLIPNHALAAQSGYFTYSVVSGTNAQITAYTGPGGVVIIPNTLGGYIVTSIGTSAFSNKGLTSVTIPNSVTSIGDNAFYNNLQLISITLGSGLISIGNGTFASTGVSSIILPDGLISIGSGAFSMSGLTSATIPNSVTTLGSGIFSGGTPLISLFIGNGINALTNGIFSGYANLVNVSIGTGVTIISNSAFVGAKLVNITIPGNVQIISNNAFGVISTLTNLTLENGIEEISNSAFSGTSLTSITIPESVDTLNGAPLCITTLSSVYFLGNAPTVIEADLFSCAVGPVTIYYISGKTGFDGAWNTYTTVELPGPPTLATQSATSITTTTATLNGNITNTGTINPTIRGFEYGLTTSYGTTITENGSFTAGVYSSNITSLTCGTMYHYQSYATNTMGTSYGGDQAFMSGSCNVVPTASAVSISGTPNINQLLTGQYSYNDINGDTEGSSTFRWLRDDVAIDGATSITYTTVLADVGHSLKFEVTPVAATGLTPGIAVVSNGISIVNLAPTASGVSFSGTLNINQLLTGIYTYFDAEGDIETSTYQWYRNNNQIDQATLLTYTTVLADVGRIIQFEVTPKASSGISPGIAIKSTSNIIDNLPPSATEVNITGTPNIYEELTGHYIYTDDDTDTEGTSTFRWLRDGVAIGGATSITYTTVLADVGHSLKFEVTPVAATGETPGESVESVGLDIVAIIQTLTTELADSITRTTATLNGSITDSGGANATVRGFEYGLTTSYGENTIEEGDFGTGVFKAEIDSLSCNKTYHYRPYSINSIGISYGEDSNFTTNRCPVSSGSTPNINFVINPQQPEKIINQTNPIVNLSLNSIVPLITRTLKVYSPMLNGRDINNLQVYLTSKGYDCGIADGMFGPITKQAVIKFQLDNGLAGDGIVGPLTKAKIK